MGNNLLLSRSTRTLKSPRKPPISCLTRILTDVDNKSEMSGQQSAVQVPIPILIPTLIEIRGLNIRLPVLQIAGYRAAALRESRAQSLDLQAALHSPSRTVHANDFKQALRACNSRKNNGMSPIR